jgi:Ribbon-helix-helix protein, copG family
MRTQIALDPEQHARIKQKAASLGITMAEYIRRLVDRDLAGVGPQASPAAIIGIGRSGGSDIAREGKRAVADAVADRTTSPR